MVAYNLLGQVRDEYAVSVHLEQKGRVVDGRVGLCRQHKVLNNVFVACPKRILFSRSADNQADGNLFDRRDDRTSLCVEFPDPPALLNLEAWQTYYGFDRAGAQADIEGQFDPQALTLTLAVEGNLPAGVAVAELHDDPGGGTPGPVDLLTRPARPTPSGTTERSGDTEGTESPCRFRAFICLVVQPLPYQGDVTRFPYRVRFRL